ncbi:MAG TPA: hypothetical protein DEH78_31080, partial [Solibacterales bacterium]|nr:hypothetical protein [Bryobacterales bacterium]
EYVADVERIGGRTLSPPLHRLFRLHLIEHRHWQALGAHSRGEFYSTLYRVEVTLGRAFLATQPPLFPTEDYLDVPRHRRPIFLGGATTKWTRPKYPA